MAVLYTCGKPVLRRHVHCAFMRSALLDMLPIMPTTAFHQRNDVERYSRYRTRPAAKCPTSAYQTSPCCPSGTVSFCPSIVKLPSNLTLTAPTYVLARVTLSLASWRMSTNLALI